MSKQYQFIIRSNQVHSSKYDYSLVQYINAHTKVEIVCVEHGSFFQTPADHYHKKSGCPICAKNTRKETNIKKYGTPHPRQNKTILEKQKQTCLKKYGVEHHSLNITIKEKCKHTMMERYGVNHNSLLPETIQKRKQSILLHYGASSHFNIPEVQEKIKQTMLKRYGVLRFNNIQKQKETIQTKYGCHPKLLTHVQQTYKQTCLEKYGVNYFNQQHIKDILPFIDDYKWLVDQYITQNKTAAQMARELRISATTIIRRLHRHEIEIRKIFVHSSKCIQWLEHIMEQEGIYIQHAANIGEFKIPGTRYKADGYCHETNTIYEFHGDYWHGNPEVFNYDVLNESIGKTMGELYQKTILKENKIISLGYNLVVLWENDFQTKKQS
ncbi:MAG: DUF7487 domain-containing protein [Nitrososphaeraceae archaeon]